MANLSTIYKNKKPLVVFLVPAFAFLLLYLFYPFLRNIVDSFRDVPGLGMPATGWNEPWYSNYQKMLTDPNMATAFRNTMIMIAATIVFQVGIALFLGFLVDEIRRGAVFFRTVYFFPIVISATALGLMFNLIFLYDGGMLNQLLLRFGLIKENIDWKGENLWLFTMLTPVMWQYVGYYFVILVTGLNNISEDVKEAARIDGAGSWQMVRYIKFPLLRNTLNTCLILAITGAIKVFDLPWTMMPNGMPLDKSWLLGTYMFKQTMLSKDIDYASAIAVFIVVLGVVISRVANTLFKDADY